MKKTELNVQRSKNASYMLWSKLAVMQSSLLQTWPAPVRRSCGLMLLALGSLLTGCAQLPTAPSRLPEPVTMPVLSQPLPLESYSTTAQKNIERWQRSLIDMYPTSEP